MPDSVGKLLLIFRGAGISARELCERGMGWGCDENSRKCLSWSFSSAGLVIHSSRQRFHPTACSRRWQPQLQALTASTFHFPDTACPWAGEGGTSRFIRITPPEAGFEIVGHPPET